MDGEEETIGKSPTKRRLLMALAIVFIAASICLAMLAALPPSTTSFEPDWLARIPAQDHSEKYINVPSWSMSGSMSGVAGPSGETVIGERVRTVEMPLSKFIELMNRDLKAKDGWKFYVSHASSSASWSQAGGGVYNSFWVVGDEHRIRVTTSFMHPLDWAEKIRYRLQKLF